MWYNYTIIPIIPYVILCVFIPGGKASDLPPPPPLDTSDYVPCPHCGRRFNEAAADRHIPKCKNIKSNKR